MKSTIRGVIVGTIGLVIAGLAGCQDNEKNAADANAFKDTKTAPREVMEQKPPTKAEMAKQYAPGGGSTPYGGGGATYGGAQKRQRR
jgi:hypothetical protein